MRERDKLLELKQIMDKAIANELGYDERLTHYLLKMKSVKNVDQEEIEELSKYQATMQDNTESLIAIRKRFWDEHGL